MLHCQNQLIQAPKVSRILIIRLGAVGDVVRTLPAASCLRVHYPTAHLAWLVEPKAQTVLDSVPWLDQILVFPRDRLKEAASKGNVLTVGRLLGRFFRELRAAEFELVVDFHSIFKSGVLGLLSGAGRRIGYNPPYGKEFGHLFATDRAELSPQKSSRFARNQGLVTFLGVKTAPLVPPLFVDKDMAASFFTKLEAEIPNFDRERLVCINPGASEGAAHKRYTVDGYAHVVAGLSQAGYIPLVTWGPAFGERAFVQKIVAATQGRAYLSPPTPTLVSLAALLAISRLYVGSDTGPMHLASLVGTPVLQLLGPTDPVENTPYDGTPWARARVDIACNPCRHGCSAAPCMSLISSDEIVRKALGLLA